MTFLPDTSTLLAYTLACFVLYFTPGPDISLMFAKTLQGGRSAGMASMFGACTGCMVHSAAAALGLSAIIAASATLFTIMKILGALYLLWLAFDAIRHGSTLRLETAGGKPPSTWATFVMGLGTNITNPKVILFFLTFLPQFITAGDPHAAQKLFFLGAYFVVFTIIASFFLLLVVERFLKLLKSNPKILRVIDYVFAGVFGSFALLVLRQQTR